MKQIGTIDERKCSLWQRSLIWVFVILSYTAVMTMLYLIKGSLSNHWIKVWVVGLSILFVVVIHEGLHGIFFKMFSGQVKFGFTLWTRVGPVFWSASLSKVSRNRMIVVILAPQLLTIIALTIFVFSIQHALIALIVLAIAAANLSGGCLDFWTLLHLRRYSKDTMFSDDGIVISVWKE